MVTYKYQVVRNGKVTNEWTSDFAGPDYYETDFGLPQRWVDADQCTPSDISSALATRQITNHDGTTTTQYELPAQYTINTIDITTQVLQRKLADYTSTRSAQADSDIQTILNPMENVTHLMLAIYNIYVALNIPGTYTSTDISNAKATLANYVNIMNQIQSIRSQRDSDIAAYKTSLGL